MAICKGLSRLYVGAALTVLFLSLSLLPLSHCVDAAQEETAVERDAPVQLELHEDDETLGKMKLDKPESSTSLGGTPTGTSLLDMNMLGGGGGLGYGSNASNELLDEESKFIYKMDSFLTTLMRSVLEWGNMFSLYKGDDVKIDLFGEEDDNEDDNGVDTKEDDYEEVDSSVIFGILSRLFPSMFLSEGSGFKDYNDVNTNNGGGSSGDVGNGNVSTEVDLETGVCLVTVDVSYLPDDSALKISVDVDSTSGEGMVIVECTGEMEVSDFTGYLRGSYESESKPLLGESEHMDGDEDEEVEEEEEESKDKKKKDESPFMTGSIFTTSHSMRLFKLDPRCDTSSGNIRGAVGEDKRFVVLRIPLKKESSGQSTTDEEPKTLQEDNQTVEPVSHDLLDSEHVASDKLTGGVSKSAELESHSSVSTGESPSPVTPQRKRREIPMVTFEEM